MKIEDKIFKFIQDHPELWDTSTGLPHIQFNKSIRVNNWLIDAVYINTEKIVSICITFKDTEKIKTYCLKDPIISNKTRKRILYKLKTLNNETIQSTNNCRG